MYSIGNNQLGAIPAYNYLYSTSQILPQSSPYYYLNQQNQVGIHGGFNRDYQMGLQGGSHHMLGLSSLNYMTQSQGSLLQHSQNQHQSSNLQHQNQTQNLHYNHHQQTNINSESHEKENHSKDRSIKRNNSNVIRDKSIEKLSFNKSTPHFFPSSENQNNNTSGSNHLSNTNNNNSGNFSMTNSNGAQNGNNHMGSQTNLKDNDKINQIQKIYNNNIRSRNNFHKSQNNFYNTHTNAFFNSNSSNSNNNNGSLDQRKKNGLSSRLSQSPSTDMKKQQNQSNTAQLTRKYYTSQQNLKYTSQASSNSQNQNPITLFQKENNNLANVYSKEYKANRNSFTSGKTFEKKDSLTQIYKSQSKGSTNFGSSTSKNTNVINPTPTFGNQNSQSKFYQTDPNFNKKSIKNSLQQTKPSLKQQLKPIEDLIMRENISSQNQIGRKYFTNTTTYQNANIFNSQPNKLTLKQQFNASNTFGKQKKKDEVANDQRKYQILGNEGKKSLGKGKEKEQENINIDYGYDMEYDEPFDQSQQSSKNPEQLYNYEIEMDQPISQSLSKTKLLTQVEEENQIQKNSLATNEDLSQDCQPQTLDNICDATYLSEKSKTSFKSQIKETLMNFKDEQKNNEQFKKSEERIVLQKQVSFPNLQSNYLESKKSLNNFELEVIQEQNKEDEGKEVPADLLQQVQKISEARPQTSEGGHRRRRKLKQFQQQAQENSQKNDEQETQQTLKLNKNFDDEINKQKISDYDNENIQKLQKKKTKEDEQQFGGKVQTKRKNNSNESEMYDLIENQPKQLDFSPLKTQLNNNCKEDYSNNEYDEDFEDCNSEQRGDGRYQYKNQLFRSQAEFYRSSLSENEINHNAATQYGSFPNVYNKDDYKKRLSFRRTTYEGFEVNCKNSDQDSFQQQQKPKMYNLFKKNSYQPLSSGEDISYQQSIPSHRIAPNGDIPIEVHVQEDDNEYVYQEISQRKKVYLQKKTIDTSDGHKIIIRHNKSAAGIKRIPKQQQSQQQTNINDNENCNKEQTQQTVNEQQQHQDDVIERVVVPFKTGLDNEFINLFASLQQ